MEEYPINSFLVCINTNMFSEKDMERLLDFIEWRHGTMNINDSWKQTLCMTTGSKKSSEILTEIRTKLVSRQIHTHAPEVLVSSQPHYEEALEQFKDFTNFSNKDRGIILVSDKEPEEFLKPILPFIVLQPKDLIESESEQEELFADFVLHLRQNPGVAMYCARSNQFVPKLQKSF